FSCFLRRVHMDRNEREKAQMVKQLVTYLFGDLMPFCHGEFPLYGDIHLRVKPMPDPAGAHVGDLSHSLNMPCRVPEFVHDLWLYPVQYPGKDGLHGLPHDPKDRQCNQETNQWVGERIPGPDAQRAKEDGEACPAIGTGMIAVRDKSGAADLFSHPD